MFVIKNLIQFYLKFSFLFSLYFRPFIILNSYSAIKDGFVNDRYLMAGRPPAEDWFAVMNEGPYICFAIYKYNKTKEMLC